MAKDALKQVFCAACSPNEPTFVKQKAGEETKVFRICKSLVEKIAPKKFDDCGMVVVAERGAPCKGDDVVSRLLQKFGWMIIYGPATGCAQYVLARLQGWGLRPAACW